MPEYLRRVYSSISIGGKDARKRLVYLIDFLAAQVHLLEVRVHRGFVPVLHGLPCHRCPRLEGLGQQDVEESLQGLAIKILQFLDL